MTVKELISELHKVKDQESEAYYYGGFTYVKVSGILERFSDDGKPGRLLFEDVKIDEDVPGGFVTKIVTIE